MAHVLLTHTLIYKLFGDIMISTSITPGYFWYDMELEELLAIKKSLAEKNEESFRQLATLHRLDWYYSGNHKAQTPSELVVFPWEKQHQTENLDPKKQIEILKEVSKKLNL